MYPSLVLLTNSSSFSVVDIMFNASSSLSSAGLFTLAVTLMRYVSYVNKIMLKVSKEKIQKLYILINWSGSNNFLTIINLFTD